jgi:hypothetical protein
MASGGMAGKIGRVTLWPTAFSGGRAQTHYRHQTEPLRWAGLSDEDAGGATDLSPIAVPMRFGPVRAGVATTINPRTRSVDPEGETMTVVTATTNTGTANIVSGDIVTTAATSFSGESRTTFTLSDGSTKRSSAIAYGNIFLPVIASAAKSVSMTDAQATVSLNALTGDTTTPTGIAIKLLNVRRVTTGTPNSGLVLVEKINAGSPAGNNVTITRNAQTAGTFKVQYQVGTADDLYIHPTWVDINLTISVAAGDPVITPVADAVTITTEQDFIDVDVLANDTYSTDVAKVLKARQETGNSGALVSSIENNKLRITRNGQGASATVRVSQYKPGTATYTHGSWVNCNVTVSAPSARWWHNLGNARGAGGSGALASHQLRSGPSYHNTSNWKTQYENKIGYMDAANGAMPGSKQANPEDNSTVHYHYRAMGSNTLAGNQTENDTIGDRSQLAWNTRQSNNWYDIWRTAEPGTCLSLSMDMIGDDVGPGEGGRSPQSNAIWDEIYNATGTNVLRLGYRNFGRRVAKNFAVNNPKGHHPKHMFMRMLHENNQTNVYQVYGPTSSASATNGTTFGAKYKRAMDRAIGWIKEGMVAYDATQGLLCANNIHWMHAPARGDKLKMGQYSSLNWVPDQCDILSVSYHPTGGNGETHALINSGYFRSQWAAGSHNYGLTDILEAANATNPPRPMCFPEWSPKFEKTSGDNICCPQADYAVKKFYEFCMANRQLVVFDCAYWCHHMWNINSYGRDDPDTTPQRMPKAKVNWGRCGDQYTYLWYGANGPSTRVARTANPPPGPQEVQADGEY